MGAFVTHVSMQMCVDSAARNCVSLPLRGMHGCWAGCSLNMWLATWRPGCAGWPLCSTRQRPAGGVVYPRGLILVHVCWGLLGFHGGWSGVKQGALKADCVQIWWPLAPPLHPSPTASHPTVPRAGGQGAASHGPRHHAHGRVCVHHLWQAVPPHRGPAQDPEPRLGRKVSIRDHGR